jgi:hypothetical protein
MLACDLILRDIPRHLSITRNFFTAAMIIWFFKHANVSISILSLSFAVLQQLSASMGAIFRFTRYDLYRGEYQIARPSNSLATNRVKQYLLSF